MSSLSSPSRYRTASQRGFPGHGSNGTGYPRRNGPLQFALTGILLASLMLLAMAAITRYAVGEPLLPPWLGKALHHPAPMLPPGMTYDFEILNPDSKRPLEALPEIGKVEMRLAVTNDSALPMTMNFKSSKQCEFIVRRVFTYVDGLFALPLEIWRSSYFHNVSIKPSQLVLQPGQTKVYESVFYLNALNAREVPEGDYRVVAIFDGWQTSLPIEKTQ
ncbi:MAG: hypothetical protein M3Z37_10555 [Candidatus Eremiobacteraeota bacterium]|nr:hypothetical protein [Candidatus Eremiobacteraeota bacterium]